MALCLSPRGWVVLLFCLLAGLAISLAHHSQSSPGLLFVAIDHDVLPANGYATTRLSATNSRGRQPSGVTWRFLNGRNLAVLELSNSESRLRAGVTPGLVTLVASAPGYRPATAELQLGLDPADEFDDGMPDFLRLQSHEDQMGFRHWFVFLAESEYFQRGKDRPTEVNDCAALIRFAYREALRKHDAAWANQWHLPKVPAAPSVRKYEYPHTGVGSNLFRTQPGAFAPDDIRNGIFTEFADADSLRRYNTHFVSRELNAARPGDLLFFRQEGHRMPFHATIYLGGSYFGPGSDWLLYHTGPSQGHAGEIRRVTVRDLQQHPEFCWRPLPQNPAFLGVYRWNILREED